MCLWLFLPDLSMPVAYHILSGSGWDLVQRLLCQIVAASKLPPDPDHVRKAQGSVTPTLERLRSEKELLKESEGSRQPDDDGIKYVH